MLERGGAHRFAAMFAEWRALIPVIAPDGAA
jgi:hypothetical protein